MCYISMSNTDFTTKSNTTRQVESFMEKDTTVQDKKKQIIDANTGKSRFREMRRKLRFDTRVEVLAPKSILLINENHVFNIPHCEGRPVEL